MWTDRSRKSGGLRFIDPGADSCNRIRNWLKQAGESGVSRQLQEFPLPAWVVEGVPDIPRCNPDKSPAPSPPGVRAREQRPVEPRPARNLPPLFHSDLTWQPPDSSGVRRGVLHQIATGFLIAAFVFACIALLENFGFVGRFRPKLANALIRLGEQLNGTRDSQPRISSPLPDLPQVPTEPPSAVKSIPDAAQPEALPSSDQVHSPAQNNSETPSPAIPRTKEGAYHSYSRTTSLAQGRSVEASRLWSAVEAEAVKRANNYRSCADTGAGSAAWNRCAPYHTTPRVICESDGTAKCSGVFPWCFRVAPTPGEPHTAPSLRFHGYPIFA